MNRIQKLTELFARFPGIGPRGAKRFVFFLLSQPKSFHIELANTLRDLGNDTTQCQKCFRYFTSANGAHTCNICTSKNRNPETLMIVEKDVDLDNIEKSGVYDGLYFVLGGTVPILDKEPGRFIHGDELVTYITEAPFTEIILAMSANPDGDNTVDFVRKLLADSVEKNGIKMSVLGRGLSTGSELEYSDRETIKNAFQNRN